MKVIDEASVVQTYGSNSNISTIDQENFNQNLPEIEIPNHNVVYGGVSLPANLGTKPRGRGRGKSCSIGCNLFDSNINSIPSNICSDNMQSRITNENQIATNSNNLNNLGSTSEVDELFNRLNIHSQRKVYMHRWNIVFSDNGKGLSLNEFLIRVNIYANAENVSESQLLANIHLLLKDKADWTGIGAISMSLILGVRLSNRLKMNFYLKIMSFSYGKKSKTAFKAQVRHLHLLSQT